MLSRNFKFFKKNYAVPYNYYVTGQYDLFEINEIPLPYWHWVNVTEIEREEPDGFVRKHELKTYSPISFGEFLIKFYKYEIYIHEIIRLSDNECFMHTNKNNQIKDIEYNDIYTIKAILI